MPHAITCIDGVRYPSVTEILAVDPKPWLERWYAKHGEKRCQRKVKASTNIGTAFHGLVEKRLEFEEISGPLTSRLSGMLTAFNKWVYDNQVATEFQDLRVVSKKHCYSGTLDWIGYLSLSGEELVLIDWKTSKAIYEDMSLQLVAYAAAYAEQTGVQINRLMIVLVTKSRPHKVKVREFIFTKKLFNKFLRLRKKYRKIHGE